jgi:hypothetical protein
MSESKQPSIHDMAKRLRQVLEILAPHAKALPKISTEAEQQPTAEKCEKGEQGKRMEIAQAVEWQS